MCHKRFWTKKTAFLFFALGRELPDQTGQNCFRNSVLTVFWRGNCSILLDWTKKMCSCLVSFDYLNKCLLLPSLASDVFSSLHSFKWDCVMCILNFPLFSKDSLESSHIQTCTLSTCALNALWHVHCCHVKSARGYTMRHGLETSSVSIEMTWNFSTSNSVLKAINIDNLQVICALHNIIFISVDKWGSSPVDG